jgi:hypothetical protein
MQEEIKHLFLVGEPSSYLDDAGWARGDEAEADGVEN